MKAARRITVLSILLAATAGWTQSPGLVERFGNLHVKEVSVVEIDTSHVKVTADLSVVSAQSVTLKDMQLCGLRLNGLPVFSAPLQQEIVLLKGVSTDLPPIYITVLFRDVNTVEPIRQMIEKQSVHLQGELVAGLQLSFVEKLALHTQHPSAEISLDQDVPVSTGGTPMERRSALAILTVIDVGLQAKAKIGKYIPGVRPAWIRDLDEQAQRNLFDVESRYALERKGQSYPLVLDELGFRVAAGSVVTTAEARTPWKYDAEFQSAVHSHSAKLEKKSVEIELKPIAADGNTFKLSRKDFKVQTTGTPNTDQVAVTGGRVGRVDVLRRASPSSLSVLALNGQSTSTGLAVASVAVAAQDHWDQVAVFRLRVDAATGKRSLEVLELGARREGNGIRLTQPVDAAVFGSPIVTPNGVIGMVQDEQAGAFLPAQMYTPGPLVAQ